MTVDVKAVANRRKVHYNSLQDLLEDAEQLCRGEVRALGNRSFVQILQHLAFAMNGSIDGSSLQIPWPIRKVGRLMRQRILAGGLTPGFKLSPANDARAWSEIDIGVPAALEGMRQSIHRLQSETMRCPHPVMGELTVKEWNTFHLRHAELHMSFVVPA
jgi:hypothetical protein